MMLITGLPLSWAATTTVLLLVALIGSGNCVFTHAAYHHPHDVIHVVRFHRDEIMKPADSRTNDGLKIYAFDTNRPNGSKAHLDTTLRSRISSAFSIGESPTLPADYFLKEYTDDHLHPEAFLEVNDKDEIERVAISFPAPNYLWMPSFTIKIMTVRAASEIPEKYYVTKVDRLKEKMRQAGDNENTDDSKEATAGLENLDTENDKLSPDQLQYDTILEETLVPMGGPEDTVSQLRLKRPNLISDLFDDIVIFVHVHPRVVSSFVYDLVTIPEYILKKDSPMYDLNPANATMNMKFLMKYNYDKDAIGIWVSRRPPIPDFSVLIAVDGDVVLNENVENPSPSAEGFPGAITHAKSKQASTVRVVVHFYERPREKNVCFLIPSYQKRIVATLVNLSNQDDDAETDRRIRQFLDYPIPHHDGFALRFTNDSYHDALTVSIVQPYPISNLMLSMFVLFDKFMAPKGLLYHSADSLMDHHASGEEERNGVGYASPILIFRKEERHVTHIPPNQTTQFGWYNAVPTKGLDLAGKTDAVYVTVAGVSHVQLAICVSFDKKDRSIDTPFDEMSQWIKDYGGDVSKVATVLNKKENDGSSPSDQDGAIIHSKHTKGNVGLVTNTEIKQGGIIADIPYKLLFTATAAEASDWVKEVMKNSTKYLKKSAELQLDAKKNQHFMIMTFFMILQFSSAGDGVDWHLYFDTIPIGGAGSVKNDGDDRMDSPNIPLFYTKDELDMFTSISPVIQDNVKTIKELAKVEYETICDAVHWFHGKVSEEQYLIARAQMENRVFNISGMLTMIPVVDHLIHNEQENVKVTFDDDEQMVKMVAKHLIHPRSRLTMDYGTETLNKFNFLVQYGFIPNSAHDVAAVKFYKSSAAVAAHRRIRVQKDADQMFERDEYATLYLTKKDESLKQLFDIIRSDIHETNSMKSEAVDSTMITKSEISDVALKFLQKELAAMPPVSKATKLPPNAQLLAPYRSKENTIKQQGERRKELEGLAQQLYDSHVSVLVGHIKRLQQLSSF